MKTLELENYGVQEMNINEMREVDGGIAPLIIYGGAVLVGFLVGAAISYYASQE